MTEEWHPIEEWHRSKIPPEEVEAQNYRLWEMAINNHKAALERWSRAYWKPVKCPVCGEDYFRETYDPPV